MAQSSRGPAQQAAGSRQHSLKTASRRPPPPPAAPQQECEAPALLTQAGGIVRQEVDRRGAGRQQCSRQGVQGAREVAVPQQGDNAQALCGRQRPTLLQLGEGQALPLQQAQQPALLKLGQQLQLLDAAAGRGWRVCGG